MLNHYQSSALSEALFSLVVLIICSISYFVLSKNEKLIQKVLISSPPVIFVLAYLFALIGSSYYIKGDWVSGEYIQSEIGSILSNIFVGIFIVGYIMLAYTLRYYKGSYKAHLLLIPIILMGAALFFIGGMTLTKDWL